ncbi:MAG: glycerol-3-phosphate 1-O-acyltransferase PlsY [Oscillospiraceae bacterium]|nr:glycerol-3-phosphate 1-O-acyltransferase PlsY [Oscillospiraceae bacterium]
MDAFLLILSAVIGYLLGSVSVAVLYTKLRFHADVRRQGSGNAGATNVARVYGMGSGVITLVGDVLKTVAAALIGSALGGHYGLCAGLCACLVGHCFPVFFGFHGGKGVAVGAALGACLDWRLIAVALIVFAVCFALSKRVSVGSLVAAVAMPVTCAVTKGVIWPDFWLLLFQMFLVAWMHRGNIKRLINGTEPKFEAHKREK